jgi:hypothetical protein
MAIFPGATVVGRPTWPTKPLFIYHMRQPDSNSLRIPEELPCVTLWEMELLYPVLSLGFPTRSSLSGEAGPSGACLYDCILHGITYLID